MYDIIVDACSYIQTPFGLPELPCSGYRNFVPALTKLCNKLRPYARALVSRYQQSYYLLENLSDTVTDFNHFIQTPFGLPELPCSGNSIFKFSEDLSKSFITKTKIKIVLWQLIIYHRSWYL